MLDIQLSTPYSIRELFSQDTFDNSIQTQSVEEKVRLLIIRDLLRLGWEINFRSDRVLITPPVAYDKDVIRASMQLKRQEIISENQQWIEQHLKLARENLVDGNLVLQSKISPIIEVCETQKQHDIFRIFRYYWSSPYSEYVGRRIKLLIRDDALPNKPLIGLAALGSSIIHIPDRDDWIGWDKKTRTNNLVYAMDAYVLGALPPYNYLLGGKLLSYLIASNEVRNIFEEKYRGKVTKISKRIANQLACIFTTSLYGKSSQYNRLNYNSKPLFISVGNTKGYGTLHLTNETFAAMRELLYSNNIQVTNRFGDGPIWRMRVIRTAADLLNINADFLLRHSFQRGIYAIPLAHNFREFLNGTDENLDNFNYPLSDLVDFWKKRWFFMRKQNPKVRDDILRFRAELFDVV
jgi:hypothetical protein